jgi:hypothetical protein
LEWKLSGSSKNRRVAAVEKPAPENPNGEAAAEEEEDADVENADVENGAVEFKFEFEFANNGDEEETKGLVAEIDGTATEGQEEDDDDEEEEEEGEGLSRTVHRTFHCRPFATSTTIALPSRPSSAGNSPPDEAKLLRGAQVTWGFCLRSPPTFRTGEGGRHRDCWGNFSRCRSHPAVAGVSSMRA